MNYEEMEMRMVYSHRLGELIEKDKNILCLEADLSKASGTNPYLSEKYQDNFINVGVSEANMMCVAAGLASQGKRPFCATFSPFATRRVYDQLTISVAYANNNVKIIGTAPGITAGPNGGTHMCFQDLAIMRAMPNMHVYCPCDAYDLVSVIDYMATSLQPAYMQLIREKMPAVFTEAYSFNPMIAKVLRPGSDLTLVSTGYMTHMALEAVTELKKHHIDAELIHYTSIKPFDAQTLIESARKTRHVITVENQSIIGGLGGAVSEVLSENLPVKVKRLGVPDRFGEVATYEYLFNKHKFGLADIITSCKEIVSEKLEK